MDLTLFKKSLTALMVSAVFAAPVLIRPALAAPASAPPMVVTVPVAPQGFAGNFLAADFAQSRGDWVGAAKYLGAVVAKDPHNLELSKRAMIVDLGAGDLDGAATQAHALLAAGDKDGLAQMALAVDALAHDKFKDALAALDAMPEDDVAGFIRPPLRGWAQAGLGVLDVDGLGGNTVHLYNGAMIALFMHKPDVAADFAGKLVAAPGASAYDIERAGDVFAATGHKDEALKAYASLSGSGPIGALLERKVAAVRGGVNLKAVLPVLEVADARQGAAGSVLDLARVLFAQHSDGSSAMFANIALALDPALLPARLLAAGVLARGGSYDAAIHEFDGLPPGNPDYVAVEQYVVELMEKAGHKDQALELLKKLYAQTHDIDILTRIGDVQREEDDYRAALRSYDAAIQQLGGPVPASSWYLLYARAMCEEELGDWTKAEADLKTALQIQPKQPYLLNFLAYGWAERGLHYPEALQMAKKALSLKPDDGFIADSVGWIEFLTGDYPAAVTQLEQAVALQPGDPTLNEHLGDAYWRAGRQAEARFQWQRALAAQPAAAQKRGLDAKLTGGLPAGKS